MRESKGLKSVKDKVTEIGKEEVTDIINNGLDVGTKYVNTFINGVLIKIAITVSVITLIFIAGCVTINVASDTISSAINEKETHE